MNPSPLSNRLSDHVESFRRSSEVNKSIDARNANDLLAPPDGVTRKRRVTSTLVARAVRELRDHERSILQALGTARLLSGSQLERLAFADCPPHNRGRYRRRTLARLVQLGLVATLHRAVGGIRAGSDGLVYCLDVLGQRVISEWHQADEQPRARRPRTPGLPFLSHTLAISEAFVSLVELSRVAEFTVRHFLTEPDCWWRHHGGHLRPDAYTLIENADFEAAFWLEVDQGTEDMSRIRSKLDRYEQFNRSGQVALDGLVPGVVFAVPDTRRRRSVEAVIDRICRNEPKAEVILQSDLAMHLHRGLLGQQSSG
jgi:hypothetical protein